MNDQHCSAKVYPNERWGAFHPHQCSRKAWKDGFCKQHHPDTVDERDKKAAERYKQSYEQNPILVLQRERDKYKEVLLKIVANCEGFQISCDCGTSNCSGCEFAVMAAKDALGDGFV